MQGLEDTDRLIMEFDRIGQLALSRERFAARMADYRAGLELINALQPPLIGNGDELVITRALSQFRRILPYDAVALATAVGEEDYRVRYLFQAACPPRLVQDRLHQGLLPPSNRLSGLLRLLPRQPRGPKHQDRLLLHPRSNHLYKCVRQVQLHQYSNLHPCNNSHSLNNQHRLKLDQQHPTEHHHPWLLREHQDLSSCNQDNRVDLHC